MAWVTATDPPYYRGFFVPPARLKRGGARNRADRISWQLTERDCHKLLDRSFDAWAAGMPLNRFITLAWGMAGIDAKASVWITGQFIKMARDWMRFHGHPMPWVWVQECGDTFGQHAHILLHVPPELDLLFRTMPRRWSKSLLGGTYVAKTCKSERLAPAYASEANPALYEAVLLGKLHYMMKCAPQPLEYALGMRGWGHKPWGQLTRVVGKRAAVWQRR